MPQIRLPVAEFRTRRTVKRREVRADFFTERSDELRYSIVPYVKSIFAVDIVDIFAAFTNPNHTPNPDPWREIAHLPVFQIVHVEFLEFVFGSARGDGR